MTTARAAAARVLQARTASTRSVDWRGSSGADLRRLPRRQQRGDRGRASRSRGWPIHVPRRRHGLPRAVRALPAPARAPGASRSSRWRNLREVYRVLRDREMLALLVDWGYRSDGIPVRFFGAWTTLPAGPAILAAKTGATILPVSIRRTPDGTLPRRDRRADPRGRRRARRPRSPGRPRRSPTRSRRAIRAAPDQWYSFKPMWPADPAEAAELEARAARCSPPTGRAGSPSGRRRGLPPTVTAASAASSRIGTAGGPPPSASRASTPCQRAPGAASRRARGSPATSRAAARRRLADVVGELWYRVAPEPGRPGPAATSRHVVRWLAAEGLGRRPDPGRGHRSARPSSASSGRPSASTPATTSRSLRAPGARPATLAGT